MILKVFGKHTLPITTALDDVKCIFNFDIGHVKPSFTMINGMKGRVVSNSEEGYIEFIK